MVLTRLITEEIQDALPPIPFSFLCDRRREGSAEAGREGAWSAGAEPMAEYEAMVSRVCGSWCGANCGMAGLYAMRDAICDGSRLHDGIDRVQKGVAGRLGSGDGAGRQSCVGGVDGLVGGVLQTTGAGGDMSACSCLAVRLMCVGHVLHMPTAIRRPRVGPQAGALGREPASFNQPALPATSTCVLVP